MGTPEGIYTVVLKNGSNWQADTFYYTPNEIAYEITGITQPNADYLEGVRIYWNDSAIPDGSTFSVWIVSRADEEIRYIGTGAKSAPTQEIYFNMPHESISGLHDIILKTEYGTFSDEYNFVKLDEQLGVADALRVSDNKLSYDMVRTDCSVKVSLKNLSKDAIEGGKVIISVYDDKGTLISTGKSDIFDAEPGAEFFQTVFLSAVSGEIGAIRAFIWKFDTLMPLTTSYVVKE